MRTTGRLGTALAALLLAVAGGLPAAAQQGEEVEITDVGLTRYLEGGRVQLVVEFRNIAQIDPSQLVVTEDGRPIPADQVEVEPISEERLPVGIVLAIDTSGSMDGEPIAAAKEAALAFVQQKRDTDFIAIVTFADEVQVVTNFINSTEVLVNLINALGTRGGTALFDGVLRSVALFDATAGQVQRNVIVLSDGDDTTSGAELTEVVATLEDGNVRVFGVALESPEFDPAVVSQITEAGDGLFLSTPDPNQLTNLYERIQRELSNTLVVRFSAGQTQQADVEFGVQYAGLSVGRTVNVPGYATTTTRPPPTATTLAQAQPSLVQGDLPASPATLRLLGTAATGLTIVLFISIVFTGNREEPGSALVNRLQAYGRRGGRQAEEGRGLLDRLPILRRFTGRAEEELRQRGLLSSVNAALEQGNVPLSPGEAIAAGVGLSIVIGGLGALFTQSWVGGIVAFAVMLLLLAAVVQWAGSREKRRFEDQLPDTLTLISTSLRAGYSLLQAVEAVAAESPNPTSREFGRAIAESRLGRPVVEALHGITNRMQSEDFAWAVMAVEIQREVGGNLAEVLQTVADTMLARNRLRGEIRALTAEGRISAFVLGVLPFAMALFLVTSNPEYLEPLYTTTGGLLAIGVGLILMIAGALWLKKIVDIEV